MTRNTKSENEDDVIIMGGETPPTKISDGRRFPEIGACILDLINFLNFSNPNLARMLSFDCRISSKMDHEATSRHPSSPDLLQRYQRPQDHDL